MGKLDRETLHMALALFFAVDPDTQIRLMAKRYLKRERSPKSKAIFKKLIQDPEPSKVVWEVYKERFDVQV